ncbi:hypothetical protein PFISCL1PPCAC_10475 [Pristionchus fissidentatus]|uniref:Methyltransferase n=1 Tax=Pristionchus fissidentatus TaxID=1538716 RepID=A0AAV5VLQ2_9BILA|nr:hypothetical protein PFISCL1PPCAC_10475 [Pristionchus fissidentatus]
MSSTEHANSSPSDPEKENSESCGYGTPTGFSFNSMPIIFVQFARLFYAGTKVTDEMISEVIQAAIENDEDAVRLSLIFASSIIQKYFIKKRYSRAVCKRFVDVYEQKKEEAPAAIYSLLTASIVEDTDFSYRLFLSRNGESAIVIREKNQTLSEGTTGLSLWQAACDLSSYLTFNFITPPTKALELGAGCGLSGIAAASLFPESEIVLTDCDANVLKQLEMNLKCNKMSERVKTLNLDWTKFEKTKDMEGTNLVLAADVVYDKTLLPSLCKVLSSLITSPEVLCLVSCTKRDPTTLEAFEKQLTSSGLRVREKCICQNGTFAVGGNSFTCDLFPHSSTLETPTVIYNIVRA